MGKRRSLFLALAVLPAFFPVRAAAQKMVPGWVWYYDAMANCPGLCVVKVEPKVVLYRVECNQPGFTTIIWQGLPRAGDYIDTLGANWVKMQAFYLIPPGESDLAGIGVHVKRAEYPNGTPKLDRLRTTNTIRVQNPDWDFAFRNQNRNFCLGGQPASQAGYQVTGPWGGPRKEIVRCPEVEGHWHWFNGGLTEFVEGGVARSLDPNDPAREVGRGTWRAVGGTPITIEVTWAKDGWKDTLTLSADGQRLEGFNQQNSRVWAERTRLWRLEDCAGVAGAWKWFNGGRAEIDGQGRVIGYAANGKLDDRATWRCVNGSPRTIEIRWTKGGWKDTLVLSADGSRLEGKNQTNARVWADRIR
jgi:hypothetical protein